MFNNLQTDSNIKLKIFWISKRVQTKKRKEKKKKDPEPLNLSQTLRRLDLGIGYTTKPLIIYILKLPKYIHIHIYIYIYIFGRFSQFWGKKSRTKTEPKYFGFLKFKLKPNHIETEPKNWIQFGRFRLVFSVHQFFAQPYPKGLPMVSVVHASFLMCTCHLELDLTSVRGNTLPGQSSKFF